MCRLGSLIILYAFIGISLGQLPAPEKLDASVEQDAALIRVSPVEGAVGYLAVLGDDDSSSVESPIGNLYFGDLDSLTEYTVIVSALDSDGVPGEPAFLVFMTGVGQVTNFQVVTTSSSIITLEWDAQDEVETYIIDAEEDESQPPLNLANMTGISDIPSIPVVDRIGEGSATLSGLKPMTFYVISIRGIRGSDMGPVSTIRARTDGDGLVIYNMWMDHMDVILGASGMIFKKLDRPTGPYAVSLTFPCEIERFEVWDAIVLNSSNPSLGQYDLLQTDLWMQEKSEIGFNYFTIYNETSTDNCFFEPNEVKISYGSDAAPSEFTAEYDMPFDVTEWNGGGILYVRMEKIFRNPNQGAGRKEAEERIVKPDRAQMAIRLVRGANCSAIDLMVCWNVDRVYNATDELAEDSYYFVQPGQAWFTNDVGIMFQYEPDSCPDRKDWGVSMLVGGDLVQNLHNTYEFQDYYDTCSD